MLLLVPKKIGDLRPILDLWYLSRYLVKEKLNMLCLGMLLPYFQQGDSLCSLVLKDACTHILIHPCHWLYLRFAIGGHHYQYRVLPFGLASAPRVFTKCLAVLTPTFGCRGCLFSLIWTTGSSRLAPLTRSIRWHVVPFSFSSTWASPSTTPSLICSQHSVWSSLKRPCIKPKLPTEFQVF